MCSNLLYYYYILYYQNKLIPDKQLRDTLLLSTNPLRNSMNLILLKIAQLLLFDILQAIVG